MLGQSTRILLGITGPPDLLHKPRRRPGVPNERVFVEDLKNRKPLRWRRHHCL